jgi:menaquinone-dependent protoporphyrinogen oxidase
MTVVSVVYASRHGATRGIAERIAEVLRSDGLDATVAPAGGSANANAEAFVVGSAVYIGSWLKDATEYVKRNAAILDSRPVWLFSSGPLGTPGSQPVAGDPVNPKVVAELADAVHPRDHGIFYGAYDPNAPPVAISERLVRLSPMARTLLPAGDFRDWPAIETWAHRIAAELSATPALVS